MFNPFAYFGQKTVGRADIGKQFDRYRSTIGWLYTGLFRYDKLRLLFALGANVGGATMRGATLSLLVVYAATMENNRLIELGDSQFSSRDPEIFVLVACSLGLLLLLSSVLFFLGGKSIVNLAVDFATHCSKLTLMLGAARPPRKSPPTRGPYPKKIPARASNVTTIARAIQPLLNISNPATMMLYSLAAVVYIDALVTAFLGLVVAISLASQYLINYHVAQNEQRLRHARSIARGRILGLLDKYALSLALHPSSELLLTREYDGDGIANQKRFFAFRMLALRKSNLVSDIVLSISAVGLFIVLGTSALQGEISWALFLGYIIFARLLLVAIRGLLSGITGFARHYPIVRELYQLLTSTENRPGDFTRESIKLRSRNEDGFGDSGAFRLRRGQRFAVISEFPVSRYNCFAFIDCLAGRNRGLRNSLLANCQWVSDAIDGHPGGNLSELLGVEDGVSNAALRKRLAKLGYGDFELAPESLADKTTASWRSLPASLRCHILLSQVSPLAPGVVLVEHAVAQAADRAFFDDWTRQHKLGFIIVRHPPQASLSPDDGERLLLMSRDGNTALLNCDWFGDHGDDVDHWLDIHRLEETDVPDLEDDD